MPKIKAYATSVGREESFILLQSEDEMPHGYTVLPPPQPLDGHQVTWKAENNEWQQVKILDPNGAIQQPA